MFEFKREREYTCIELYIYISMSAFHLSINMKSVKRQRISYNSFENLSNEIFYEIFDYLDGYDIYRSFSKLNDRFTDLIMDGSYLLKFQISPSTYFDFGCQEWIRSNRHRILSFHVLTEVYVNCSQSLEHLNASYIRLESLILSETCLSKLCEHVSNLHVLPQLVSLDISFFLDDDDIEKIYQMIFSLPKLTNFRIQKVIDPRMFMIMPMSPNGDFSSLNVLSICHFCPIDVLMNLLSYTPHLCRLRCPSIHESDFKDDDDEMKSKRSIELNHLERLTISVHGIFFDEFEQYLSMMCSQLEIMHLSIRSSDRSYLDSDRWEKIITNKMKHLKQFSLCYSESLNDRFQIIPSHISLHRFNSSFWFNRKMNLNVEIDDEDVIYSIIPAS